MKSGAESVSSASRQRPSLYALWTPALRSLVRGLGANVAPMPTKAHSIPTQDGRFAVLPLAATLRRLFGVLLACGCLLVSGKAVSGAVPDVGLIHEERSAYQNVLVTQNGSLRCLNFTLGKRNRRQSCMDLDDPRRLVFAYVRMMFTSLSINPRPRHILMAGLGGGSIPSALQRHFPEARILVVEIDPAVVRVARKFFAYEDRPGTELIVGDVRVQVRRLLTGEERFDLILLDAFTGDYIPEHLMTREFLLQCRELLTPGGVLVANTFSGSRLYDHESVTYVAAFGEILNLRSPSSGNRLIFAGKGPLPSQVRMLETARRLAPRFAREGIELALYVEWMSRKPDWDPGARVLTDSYSPANLLRAQP